MSAAVTVDEDVAAMLRDSAVDFVAKRHDTARLKGRIGQPRTIDRAQWLQMGQMGWLGLAMPEALGGSGMGVVEAATLSEVLGRHLFPEPFIAAALMPAVLLGASVARDQPDRQDRRRVLADGLNSGEVPLTLAWQEAAGELGAFPAATQLRSGCLTGVKQFVPAVEEDGLLLVSATADGAPVWVEIPTSASGVLVETRASACGTLSTVRFDAAPVSGEPLCRGVQALQAQGRVLDAASVCAAAYLAGIAAGCLDRTVSYVNQRVQFGHPLSAFQTVAHRCVDLLIGTQLADASWRHAAALVDTAGQGLTSSDAINLAVSATKARCSDVALQVGRVAVQLHGGMGFTEEADIGLYLRVALQHAAWLGNGAVQRRRFMGARERVFSREAEATDA